MVAFLIILLVIAIAVILYFAVFKKELFMFFSNSITSKVEKKKRIEGEVEVLKKEQKVKCEEVVKSYGVRKAEALDAIIAQINSYKALIKNLEVEKKNKSEMLDQELKVQIDKITNSYDQRIISKKNQAKKLGYYIDAEQKNIEDVTEPEQPNAPTTKPVVEVKPTKTANKSTKKTTKK